MGASEYWVLKDLKSNSKKGFLIVHFKVVIINMVLGIVKDLEVLCISNLSGVVLVVISN